MAKSDGKRVKISRKDFYEIKLGDREPLRLSEAEAADLLEGLEAALGSTPAAASEVAPEELAPSGGPSPAGAVPEERTSKPARIKEVSPKQRRRQTMIMSGIVIVIIAAAFVAFNLQAAPSGGGGPVVPPKGPYEHFSVTGEGDITFNGTRPGPSMTAPDNTTVWVTFTVSSTSSVKHSWVLVPGNTSHNVTTPDITPVFANATSPNPTIGTAPGKTDQIVFKVTQPGTYLYICEVPGHFQEGMYGYLNVTASNSSSNATAIASQSHSVLQQQSFASPQQLLAQAETVAKSQLSAVPATSVNQ